MNITSQVNYLHLMTLILFYAIDLVSKKMKTNLFICINLLNQLTLIF